MSKDLVERLRQVRFFSDGLISMRTPEDCDIIEQMRSERKEAADEIEKLRKLLFEVLK
jgi:hypothetical protein